MFGAGLRRGFPRCQSQSSPWGSPWVRGEMWRSFSRLLSGATRRSLRAEGFDTAKDSAFTRRLSQTTACTCKQLFSSSLSILRSKSFAIRAAGGEIQAGRAGDLRGRLSTAGRRRGCSGSPSELFAPATAGAAQLRRSWKRPAAAERHAAPSAPGRTASAAPADAPKGRRSWSVRRWQPAETRRCAADRCL